jgi:hypothetical protein
MNARAERDALAADVDALRAALKRANVKAPESASAPALM